MAPRSKSARLSKARPASNVTSAASVPTESLEAPAIDHTEPDEGVSPPQTPISSGRTYAQAVRSAPPSPRMGSVSTRSAPAATITAPDQAPTEHHAEVGHDSLGDTSITVRVPAYYTRSRLNIY